MAVHQVEDRKVLSLVAMVRMAVVVPVLVLVDQVVVPVLVLVDLPRLARWQEDQVLAQLQVV